MGLRIWKDWDEATEKERIERWIKDYFSSSGFKNGVIGLSGGLDSSVVAYLLKGALGSENVKGVVLPDDEGTPLGDMLDALKVLERLRIKAAYINITPVVRAIAGAYQKVAESNCTGYRYPNAYGNLKARTRMIMLYAVAQTEDAMVVGTTDKSEWLMGYFTKYGDGGVDVEPILHLYKTQVRMLGKYLRIPRSILSKPSSPSLLPNQTAEKELGIDYETLDLVLYNLIELKRGKEEIVSALDIDECLLDRVIKRIKSNAHKRSMPPSLHSPAHDELERLIEKLYGGCYESMG